MYKHINLKYGHNAYIIVDSETGLKVPNITKAIVEFHAENDLHKITLEGWLDGVEKFDTEEDYMNSILKNTKAAANIDLKEENIEKVLKSVNDFEMKARIEDFDFPMSTTTVKKFDPKNYSEDALYMKEYSNPKLKQAKAAKYEEPKKTQTEVNLENEITDLRQRNKSLEKEVAERGRLLMKATVQDFIDAPGPILNNTIMIIIEKDGKTAADYEFHTLLGNVDKVIKDLEEYDLENSTLFIRCNEDVYKEQLKPILVDIPHRLV